jgi:hypothetical protein
MPYPVVEHPARPAAAVPGPQGTFSIATSDCLCRCCPHRPTKRHPDAVFGAVGEPGNSGPIYPVVEFPGIEC